jgi:hypothetical protein
MDLLQLYTRAPHIQIALLHWRRVRQYPEVEKQRKRKIEIEIEIEIERDRDR